MDKTKLQYNPSTGTYERVSVNTMPSVFDTGGNSAALSNSTAANIAYNDPRVMGSTTKSTRNAMSGDTFTGDNTPGTDYLGWGQAIIGGLGAFTDWKNYQLGKDTLAYNMKAGDRAFDSNTQLANMDIKNRNDLGAAVAAARGTTPSKGFSLMENSKGKVVV